MNQKHKALVKECFEAWGACDADKVATLVTDDIVLVDHAFANTFTGIDEVKQFASQVMTGVEYTYELKNFYTTESDDSMVATWEASLINQKNGETIKFSGISKFDFRDDKICFENDYYDGTEVKAQFPDH